MSLMEEHLFWKTAHYLIVRNGYRIIQLSNDQNEIWLEKRENKAMQLIRLLRYDLDWSSWLQRDIQKVAEQSSRLKAGLAKRELQVANIYFSSYPPVDSYESILENPVAVQKGKVEITSMIGFQGNGFEPLKRLEEALGIDFEAAESGSMEDDTQRLKEEALSAANARAKEETSFFQSGKPFFSFIFIGLQIIVFLLMELRGGSTNTSTLIEFGAKFNPLILEGEWWRFFMPMVIHIGFLHLLMNSLALYYLGPIIERIFGNLRFLAIYLFAGFAGTLASFLFSSSLSAGASGAIFGCFGALLYFGMVFPNLFFRTMGRNVIFILVINLIFGFTMPGIDNAGHLGGLAGGFAAAAILHFPKKKASLLKRGAALILTIFLVGGMLQYGFTEGKEMVDEETILVLAQEYIQEEEYEKARGILLDYREEMNHSPDILFLLSFSEIKLENLDAAEAYLYEVIEMEPGFHEAQYNLALVLLQREDFSEALKHAEEAVRLQPDNEDYHHLVMRLDVLQ